MSSQVARGQERSLDNSKGKAAAFDSTRQTDPFLESRNAVKIARETRVKGITLCGKRPLEVADLSMREDRSVSIGRIICDDPFCPHPCCGAARAVRDGYRLHEIIREAKRRNFQVYHTVLTIRTTRDDGSWLDPAEQLAALDDAFQAPSKFARTKVFREAGFHSTVVRIESTLTPDRSAKRVKHHYHMHVLFFFDGAPGDDEIAGAIKKRWLKRVRAIGHEAYISCQHVKRVNLATDDGIALARYIGGDTTAKSEGRLPDGDAGVVSEMSGGANKEARGMGHAAYANWVCSLPDDEQEPFWREYRRCVWAGRNDDGTRGRSYLRIAGALFDLFKSDDESGGEYLQRIADEQLAATREVEEQANPVIRSAQPPRRWLLALMSALGEHGLDASHIGPALSGKDSLSRATQDQLFDHLDLVLSSAPAEQDKLAARYVPLLAHYIAWTVREQNQQLSTMMSDDGGRGGTSPPAYTETHCSG